MSQPDYDVAIVGLGPVGAFTALQLARAGFRVAIYERSTEPVVLPRAVGLDGESQRSFQRIGRGDAVAALLQPARESDAIAFTNSKREPYFEMPMPPHRGPNGWRDVTFFDQPELEAQLREWVDEDPGIDTFLGHEAIGLEDEGECVKLALRENVSGRESRVSASYVVGCDGASSWVRRALGIEWTSLGYDQDWLVIDIVVKDVNDLPFTTMQVCDPERLTTYVCVKDPNRRWEFQLVEGETWEEMVEPERITSLLDSWIDRDRYQIRRAAVYQFHAATADHWRHGRVLLAGDAAHQTPPFLGQGLNSGFRDAVNLGWKLPLVLRGTCDAKLLDSYFDERDAHARDLVDWAVGIGKLMETLAAREAGRPAPHPEASQQDGYGQGRSVPPLRGGVLRLDQAPRHEAIGFLLRQPGIRRSDGSEGLFDELIGPDFAIVGRTKSDCTLDAESSAIFDRIGGRSVALDEVDLLEDRPPGATVIDVVGTDIDRIFESSPAVLLRPDRIVFGVVEDETNLDDLVRSLAEQLSLH